MALTCTDIVMNCGVNMENVQTQPGLNLEQLTSKQSEHQRMVDCCLDMGLNDICRVCLDKNQNTKNMCSIFEESKPAHFSLMIMACASVQVIEGDGLPSMICNKCVELLTIAWEFKRQCENSDIKLRHYFNTAQHLQVTPDLEGFNIIKEEGLFALNESQIIPVLQQNHNQQQIQTLTSMPEPTNCNTMQNMYESDDRTTTNKSTCPIQMVKQERAREPKQHQCDTCGKTFNRREYLTQHIRIHTGEKPYHCHLCGKRFINSGHLTTHMRTHTGERPHKCTLCPKAFSTRQELNKHTMVHSGERPFVCKLCGKRFGSSSNLYSHLKHHTGEKNFTCEQCGKAFYTKQELKQHFVVHTGEKAFLCEYCNKRFSQIAHLRRHSKLHK